VCRSIGDAYLKKQEFNKEPLLSKFRLREPFDKPILSSEPSVVVQPLQPHDQFLIFASDGLWEQLTNQEAVDIVNSDPQSVSYSFLCVVTASLKYIPSVPFYLSPASSKMTYVKSLDHFACVLLGLFRNICKQSKVII
jgi:hypothetical protein